MNTPHKKRSSLLTNYKAPHVGALTSALGLAVMVGGIYVSSSASTVTTGTGCLNPALSSSYETSFTRGTGTISTKGGLALCTSASLVLESFSVPKTWNGQGFNSTAIPQKEFAAVVVTLPAGQTNVKKTASVDVPPSCENTQVDYYFPPAYPAITALNDDNARYIGGVLYGGIGSCTHPTPTPTPLPTPTPVPSPGASPSKTPTPTPQAVALLECTSLKANVTSGSAPLTVTFTGAGKATGQSIDAWQFDFGDNSQISTTSPKVERIYTTPGVYTATLTLKGSTGTQTGVTPGCSVTIHVGGVTSSTNTNTPAVQGISTAVLPQTGVVGPFATVLGALLVTAGAIHIWITQRKNLLVAPAKRNDQ